MVIAFLLKNVRAARRQAGRIAHGAGLVRFACARSGAAAVEFALVALPFFALMFAILDTALVFFANQSLEFAVAESGRLILTGQAQSGNFDQTAFKNSVCQNAGSLIDCNKLYVNVQNFSSFANASTTPPYDKNGQLDTSQLTYQPGSPDDIVVVSLYYQWPITLPLDGLSNQNGNSRLLVATSAFRNEPYQ